MTTKSILESFTSKGIISAQQAEAIASFESAKTFSVHWELRSILYLGILLFSSGVGLLIYEHIDTIGHQVIIAAIALLTIACFWYVYRNRLPYSNWEVKYTSKFMSYVLLIGCTSFLALEGYLQFQYQLFGSKYGVAVLIPTLLFFFCSYRFDHVGVLSMAITGLASWLGLTVAPLSVLAKNDFTDDKLIWSAIILGAVLLLAGWLSEEKNIKRHFAYTYLLLGGNLACLAALVGLMSRQPPFAFFIAGVVLSTFLIFTARKAQSLLFLLMGVIYAYIQVTYMLGYILEDWVFAFATFYFMLSSIGVILFLLNYKKFLGIKK